ncbi:MAG: hypothetical protein PF904_00765 [Kiritimatiellae bacterium]|nr:hypothetical protein [Kiritimatiellia bacterium]
MKRNPIHDGYRGYMRGSFWGSAQEYMEHGNGVYPYFCRHSGRGLEVLEKGRYKLERPIPPSPRLWRSASRGTLNQKD